jgi:hypothetical protein
MIVGRMEYLIGIASALVCEEEILGERGRRISECCLWIQKQGNADIFE